jgi:hypothetical protein
MIGGEKRDFSVHQSNAKGVDLDSPGGECGLLMGIAI